MSRNANNPSSILKSFIFSQQILIHSTGWQYTDYVRMLYPGCGEYRVKPQDMCFALRWYFYYAAVRRESGIPFAGNDNMQSRYAISLRSRTSRPTLGLVRHRLP